MIEFLGKPPINRIIKNILDDPFFILFYFLLVGIVVIELVRIRLKIGGLNTKKALIISYAVLILFLVLGCTGMYLVKY